MMVMMMTMNSNNEMCMHYEAFQTRLFIAMLLSLYLLSNAGITCSDVPSAIDVLNTRYRLGVLLFLFPRYRDNY